MTALAPTLEAFFTDRLIRQRQVSTHSVIAYRDTFRLLLGFVQTRTGRAPSTLNLEDLDAALISAFLDHLEVDRHNKTRTRNARLAAVHSLFRFAALRHPENSALIQRVLAMPPKRYDRTIVAFLDRGEVDALLAAPDRGRWIGRRDHAVLLLAVQTGLRVSELTALTNQDVHLGPGAHIRCTGKGRKERCTPLTAETVGVLRAWMHERGGQPTDALFPTSTGRSLGRDAVALLAARHTQTAAHICPSLRSQGGLTPHLSPHRGHAAAPRRSRPLHHRPVARPRTRREHADLHPRRSNAQRTSSRSDHPARRNRRPLSTPRYPPRLPGATPLTARIMPTLLCRSPLIRSPPRHNQVLGITHLARPGALGRGEPSTEDARRRQPKVG